MSSIPRIARRALDSLVAEAPRLLEAAEQQTGTSSRFVAPTMMEDDALGRASFEDLLAFAKTLLGLICFAKLC